MYEKVWNQTKIAFGGDYNPEQWPEEVWDEDMRLFRLAHVDTVTLNVFSWASLQPSEDTYDFAKLDKIMECVTKNDLKVVLATSTGAHPAWMARKYPEILMTDYNGMKRKFGGRHNSCPNSSVYRKYSSRLAAKLAERYGHYKNIVAWHISNEYGGGGECYCENCEKAFRKWLKKKYGTISELNRVWNTSFWGHTFYDWDEIVLPNVLSEQFGDGRTMFQGISLDYRRFHSDSLLECYILEYDAIKTITPDIPITTNLMGFFTGLDYGKWAKHMDFVSWDNYPSNDMLPAEIAMGHEIMRGVGSGRPFILMEQTPSVTNWLPYNALKRPGVMRLWSYQAIAHGSDSVMFFQMRRSIGACEKYHGALIDHAGHEHTRVFREMAELGAELAALGGEVIGSRIEARAAVLFDWDNWWAVEYSAGPSCMLHYLDEARNYYKALFAQNIPVDIIGCSDDFSKYSVIFAPILYMVKPGVDTRLCEFVKAGGRFVTTYFSGYVDEHDLVVTGGYPGKLRELLGIWVEESDALPEGASNHFTWEGCRYEAKLLCDLLHLEGAEALAFYEEDFYADMPVLTRNNYGSGSAWYVAAQSEEAFYEKLTEKICADAGVRPVPVIAPRGVEATVRTREEAAYLFLLNHTTQEQTVFVREDATVLSDGAPVAAGSSITLPKYGVVILKQPRKANNENGLSGI